MENKIIQEVCKVWKVEGNGDHWYVDENSPASLVDKGRREAKRECADTLEMLLELEDLKNH